MNLFAYYQNARPYRCVQGYALEDNGLFCPFGASD